MKLQLAVFSTVFAVAAAAQSTQTMRANVRGDGGDNGKCTIEVEVDGVADVEVRGSTGYIRTLSGQPSTWRRFECNGVIPNNPQNFRFKGVDGRGKVQLVRSPDRNGSAVVRIEDPSGGREGYTFDLEWTGGYGTNDPNYNSGDGRLNPDNNNDNRNNRNNRDPYYNDNRNNRDPYYNNPNDRNQRNSPYYNNDTGQWASSTVSACETAVRQQARRDHNVRNPRFFAADVQEGRGNRERVVGAFEGLRGEQYMYSCVVNENNGRIRNVEIRRR